MALCDVGFRTSREPAENGDQITKRPMNAPETIALTPTFPRTITHTVCPRHFSFDHRTSRKMPRKDPNAGASTAKAQQEAASDGIDAYELPKSLVTKLARSAVCTRLPTCSGFLTKCADLVGSLASGRCEDAKGNSDRTHEGVYRVRQLPW